MNKKIKFPFKFRLSSKVTKVLIIFLALISLVAFLFNIKHLFIAAMVNGRPITHRSLTRELEKQMGKQVLEGLIAQTLVRQEAKQQKIEISQEKVKEQINQIETQLKNQGQELDTLLAAQGQTRKSLGEQIELQLIVEEILGRQVSVSEEEVKDYFEESKEQFVEGTTFEDQKENLKEQLRQGKISEKFQPWLEELRGKAKIYYFLRL